MGRITCVVLGLAIVSVVLGGCSGGGGDDPQSFLSFLAAAFSVNEDGTPITQITLTRTGNLGQNVSVTVFLTNGTATGGPPPLVAPTDYDNSPIVVTWVAGDGANKVIAVPVLNDNQDEGDETVNLGLGSFTGNATGGAITAAVLTIVNDDVAGALQFSAPTYSYFESGGFVTQVTVQRVGGMDGDISGRILSMDGTANSNPLSLVEPVDYTPVDIIVSFADQVTTDVLVVLPGIVQDPLPELDETFTLTIVSTTGNALIGAIPSAEVTILNGDFQLEIPDAMPSINGLYGASVAKLGPRLAIGAPGANSGQGRVDVVDPSIPAVGFSLTETLAQQYGAHVTVDGFDLVVGSEGEVFVYDSDGFSSFFRFSLLNAQDGFGTTGIGSGDGRLAIGAPGAQLGGSLEPSGQALIYSLVTGLPLHTIDGIADNMLGASFARHAGGLLIGAPGNTGTALGYAGVPFALSAIFANPVPLPANPSPSFGASVASIGGVALVGAPDEDTLVADAGVVYVFNATPPQTVLAPLPFVPSGRFGSNVAVVGNRICVQQEGGGTSACGRVFIHDSTGALVGVIDDPTPSANADFGASMCEFDGAIVIAAPRQGAILQPGSVFIFLLP